jgi:hypothetical protein
VNLSGALVILVGVALLRIIFAALAGWSFVRWLQVTFETTKAHSDSLVVDMGPDATPYDELPTARQRIDATLLWHTQRAQRIGWLWDAQIARMFILAVGLAAAATLLAPWSAWYLWIPLGLSSLWPLTAVRGLEDQRRRALAALASRGDILTGKITTP